MCHILLKCCIAPNSLTKLVNDPYVKSIIWYYAGNPAWVVFAHFKESSARWTEFAPVLCIAAILSCMYRIHAGSIAILSYSQWECSQYALYLSYKYTFRVQGLTWCKCYEQVSNYSNEEDPQQIHYLILHDFRRLEIAAGYNFYENEVRRASFINALVFPVVMLRLCIIV